MLVDPMCTNNDFSESREAALKIYSTVRTMIEGLRWNGMDRQALELKLDRLDAVLSNLKDRDEAKRPAEVTRDPDGDGLARLTKREIDVLTCIAEGNSTKQAAAILGITFKTASCHRYRIMDKLGIHDAVSLVRYAIRNGLIEA